MNPAEIQERQSENKKQIIYEEKEGNVQGTLLGEISEITLSMKKPSRIEESW